ncbi:MAG: hypothetical protein AAB837_00565 [Patescibacteria group bacterium]
MDYKETIKERLDVLSPELKAFVLDENWRREAEKVGQQFNFDEEKYALFENEVFLVLLCFEPKTDFAENIKRELEIDSNVAGFIAEDVEKNIFSKVTNEIDSMWQTAEQEETPTQSGVGNSFEQIILNQAKAMRVAIPPENLPIKQDEPSNFAEATLDKKAIHNYITESDPYREPIL